MNSKNDPLTAALETAISAHLQMEFHVKDYKDGPADTRQFIVNGVISHHGTPANVEVTVEKEGLEITYWFISDEAISMPSKRIGRIKLGKDICVSDPCYDRDVWCMTQLHNVLPGMWNVNVVIDTIDCWGERVYVLELFHNSLTSKQKNTLSWTSRASLGVDSGTMSVIDDRFYRRLDGSVEAFEASEAAHERFNADCFKLTDNHAGIYKANGKAVGAVCSSGIGDGVYPLDVAEIDLKIVAMQIKFM